tara:strand:+ start:389 stop:589 length:201 start_codon:yes stop_codon:yes gene_type:complete
MKKIKETVQEEMQQQPQQQPQQELSGQTVTVPLDTLNLVFQTLSKRPYMEVSEIIQKLQNEAVINQ